MTLPKGTLDSVASLLAAILYQGNPDRHHKLWPTIKQTKQYKNKKGSKNKTQQRFAKKNIQNNAKQKTKNKKKKESRKQKKKNRKKIKNNKKKQKTKNKQTNKQTNEKANKYIARFKSINDNSSSQNFNNSILFCYVQNNVTQHGTNKITLYIKYHVYTRRCTCE